ncbi:C45 family peptidase [Virgibacillus necropolis]|uniref:C45 family autoproteolytic acyltransferase/hydolase n=1 Tax=Virgibacillus necropolis TaxID=163877 RepID=UPI00384E9F46
MEPIEVSVEQYRDTAYNIGWLQGQRIDNSLIANISKLESASFDPDKAKEVFIQYAPHLLDEIEGLADALEISYKEAASLFSGYDIPKLKGMGCSSVVNQEFAVRNYDFTPEIYDHRLVFVQPKECFASVGHSLHVLGRHEGVNEKGLFLAFHFVNNDQTAKGLTASTIVRIVLDTCKSTEEAIELLKQLPHSWSYNFSIGDSLGRRAIVEITPFEVKIRSGVDTLLCTNHFQHQDMVNKNRVDHTNSHKRITHMDNKNLDNLSGKEVFEWFRNPNSGMFYKDYYGLFGTLHTFAYLFSNDIVLTTLPYGKTLIIDWKSWLEGNDVKQRSLRGNLDY